MYERHFGLSGLPFQLSPDPGFYFDSQSHHAALSALRQAFVRERPFIVLSGDIGAGKTTVLRAWADEMRSQGVVVGQITNTQLDADELLRSVAMAFGAYLPDRARQESDGGIAALLGLFPSPMALLIVDEAQNLDAAALQHLVRLADAANESAVKLRIALAGQPELRERAATPEVQARLQHASHLGPLDALETRAYMEHRLSTVGWSGVPSFDATAFDEIHRVTGGIPRRVNVLGNRLMLAKYLEGGTRVDARSVVAAAHALHVEIGEGVAAGDDSVATAPADRPDASGVLDGIEKGAIIVVCGGRSDRIKAVPLILAMACRRDLPPARLVSLGADTGWALDRELHAFAGLDMPPVTLVDEDEASLDRVESAFERLLLCVVPAAVIVFDGDERIRRCARAAHDFDVPLVHVGADAQLDGESGDDSVQRSAIARLADRRFGQQGELANDVMAADAVLLEVGNLAIDALYLALEFNVRSPRGAGLARGSDTGFDAARGYGVVALNQLRGRPAEACRPSVVPILRALSRDLPLLWPMRRTTMLAMKDSGLARTMAGDGIACIDELGHAGFVRLLRDATCVLTDVPEVMEEAASLGVPCLNTGASHVGAIGDGWMCAINVAGQPTKATRALWEIMFKGPKLVAPPPLWDGHAAPRIAAHLAHWLADVRTATAAARVVAPQDEGWPQGA